MQDETIFANYIQNLKQNVEISYSRAVSLQHKNYDAIKYDVHNFFASNFHGFQGITLYGSRMAGLASDKSDLDIQIKFNYFTTRTFYYACNLLLSVSEFSRFQCIEEVPSIKVIHNSSGITCDLVFKDDIGVNQAEALHFWLDIQEPEAKKFVLFIREWFKMSQFGQKYRKMLDMMSVYWLVRKNLLPSFRKMQIDRRDPYCIEFRSQDYNFYDNEKLFDFRDFIKGFFNSFGSFNWEKKIVCPYIGVPVRKKSFTYYRTIKWREDTYQVDLQKTVIVQSFLDLSKNFANGVSRNKIEEFSQFCRDSQSLFGRLTNYR